MQRGRVSETVLVGRVRLRLSLLRAVSLAASIAALSLFTMPALLDQALGGALQSVLPPAVFNAIHELRHLMGMPCH